MSLPHDLRGLHAGATGRAYTGPAAPPLPPLARAHEVWPEGQRRRRASAMAPTGKVVADSGPRGPRK